MKKVILIVCALVTGYASAQIVVNETGRDSVYWSPKMANLPKLVGFKTGENEAFAIYYRNAKYTTLVDVDYISTESKETTRQFFEICQQVATDGKEVTLTLAGKAIIISKSMGAVMIWKEDGYFYITKKQIGEILESL